MDNMCEKCIYFSYDSEYEDYICTMDMDEDEVYRLSSFKKEKCPFFRDGDEYSVVRKQV
jgi:hypothetical protein